MALVLLLASWGLVRAEDAPVLFLQSPASAAYFKTTKTSYEDLLVPWRSFFQRNHIAVREVSATQLARAKGKAVLIIPSAVVLTPEERKAILGRASAGWSIVGSGPLGTRDEKGAATGYSFIEELFGVKVVYDKPADKEYGFLLPYGETPLTYRLSAGKRMYMRPSDFAPLRLQADHGAGRLTNYMRDAASPEWVMPVISFQEVKGSRRAFIGISEGSWDSAQAEIDALLLGTLDWMKRKPIVFKSAWPGDYEAALLLEMDTEDKFANGSLFASQLERENLRGTFFCLTSEAVRNKDTLKRIAGRHEIAYHADVHDGFNKVAPAQQDARIKNMAKQLASVLPEAHKALGFRPPLEEADAQTEKALRANRLAYMAGSIDVSDSALPRFSAAEPGVAPDEALVLLPRTWIDDIALLRAGKLDVANVGRILLASLDATLATRDFGLLSVHSQHFAKGSPLERAMPAFLQAVAKTRAKLWTTSGDNIARWWRDHEAVKVSTRLQGRTMAVQLRASRDVAAAIKLVVIPPESGKEPKLDAGELDARLTKLDDQRWAIILPKLKAGSTDVRIRF